VLGGGSTFTLHLLYNKQSWDNNQMLLAATIPQAHTAWLVHRGRLEGFEGQELCRYVSKKCGHPVTQALIKKCIEIEGKLEPVTEEVGRNEHTFVEMLQKQAIYLRLQDQLANSRSFQQQMLENPVGLIEKVYNTCKRQESGDRSQKSEFRSQ